VLTKRKVIFKMDVQKLPTIDLVKKITELDYDIESKILLYNNIYEELIRRFPLLKEQIQPKEYKKSNL
jgi:hypothetical protein